MNANVLYRSSKKKVSSLESIIIYALSCIYLSINLCESQFQILRICKWVYAWVLHVFLTIKYGGGSYMVWGYFVLTTSLAISSSMAVIAYFKGTSLDQDYWEWIGQSIITLQDNDPKHTHISELYRNVEDQNASCLLFEKSLTEAIFYNYAILHAQSYSHKCSTVLSHTNIICLHDNFVLSYS